MFLHLKGGCLGGTIRLVNLSISNPADAIDKKHGNDRSSPIPKELWPPALGCEERATLGGWLRQYQPQRVCVGFPISGATPLGLLAWASAPQVGSCLAILGLATEFLWDSEVHSKVNTTTDFAGSVAENPLSVMAQPLKAAGFTSLGCSNVLCA